MARRSPIVGDVRGADLMLGIELVEDKAIRRPFAPRRKIGLAFDRIAYENGLVARCMGDVLGFSPPLVVDARDMDEIARRCETSLRNLERLLEADPLDRPA
jgi:4-aminobutyrate--pyruvate transaminase